ncbi:hypothetical protein BDC45DRAFT_605877 [Circinella umbellata]|nr:hypothetical protein BDC45DRAFT_605877 [Circinella umbellata]
MYEPTEETLPLSTSDIDIGRIAKNLHERLENVENDKFNLQEQLLDSKEKQSELGIENDRLHKKIVTLQQDLNTYINNQSRLEVHNYTQEQELTDLRKEVTQLTKEKNDLQKKLKLELDTFENNQLKWEQREETLCKQIRRLTETERSLQNNNTKRLSSINNNNNNNNNKNNTSSKKKQKPIESTSSSSPPSSYSLLSNPVTIDNNNTVTTRRTCSVRSAHESQVTELKQQLKTQETRLVKEMEDQDKRHSKRIRKLITEISNMKQINQSLMEENEGYQNLLNEKTMNGSFLLLGDKQDSTRKENYNQHGTTITGFSNLAAELHNVSTVTINSSYSTSSSSSSSTSSTSSNGDTKQPQSQNSAELYSEIKSLKDANNALNLYISKILIKIIENEDLEYLLSVDQQQQQQGQRVTFSQLDNNDTGTNTPPSNQIHNNNSGNNPPIMRKSFSSTMLSKILRRRRQNDQQEEQQINSKIHDNRSITKSLLTAPLKQLISLPAPAPAAPETSNNSEGRSQCKEELLIKPPSITG